MKHGLLPLVCDKVDFLPVGGRIAVDGAAAGKGQLFNAAPGGLCPGPAGGQTPQQAQDGQPGKETAEWETLHEKTSPLSFSGTDIERTIKKKPCRSRAKIYFFSSSSATSSAQKATYWAQCRFL